MIITVEGYNGKKNRATMVTAMLASMMAMKKGLKTLVLQLIDPNIDTVEGMLNGTGREKDVLRGQDSMSDEGIDALLREAEVQKLMKSDFDQYCTSILTAENQFDVATITKNGNFTSFLEARCATLQQCIENAMDVYECIIILLPTGMPHISQMIKDMKISVQDENGKTGEKSLVDKSIYCMRQGFMRKCDVSGSDIIYLLTDYDETSRFLGNDMAKIFCPKKFVIGRKSERVERMYKVTRNVAANDAALSGTLARFVRENRQLDPEDSNFIWTNDMTKLLACLTGEKEVTVNDRWEAMEILAHEKHVLTSIAAPMEEKQATEAKISEESLEVVEVEEPVAPAKTPVRKAAKKPADVEEPEPEKPVVKKPAAKKTTAKKPAATVAKAATKTAAAKTAATKTTATKTTAKTTAAKTSKTTTKATTPKSTTKSASTKTRATEKEAGGK